MAGKRKYGQAFGRRTYNRRTRGPRRAGGGFRRRRPGGNVAMVKPEFKVINEAVTSTAIDDTGILFLINGITKGDDINNRIGRSITMMSVLTRMSIKMNAMATNTQVRACLVMDTQPNGAVPALTEIWNGFSLTSTRVVDGLRRFWVLKDRTFHFSDAGNNNITFKHYKKIKAEVRFDNSDAGDITDILKNSLFWIFVADETTNEPTVVMNTQIRFLD